MTKEAMPSGTEKLNEETGKAIEGQAQKESGANHDGHHETGPVGIGFWTLFGIVTIAVFAAKKAYQGLEWLSGKAEAGKIELGKGGGGHGGDHGGGHGGDHGGGHGGDHGGGHGH